jgi:hypothetical protein
MRNLLVAVAMVVMPAALTVGAAAGIRLAVLGAQPVKKVAVCYGIGCRGTVCPGPADMEPSVSGWHRKDPKGDFSSMCSRSTGQREAPATY